MKKLLFLSLVILAGCGHPKASNEKTAKNNINVKPKASPAKRTANLWTIGSFAPKEEQTERIKFVRFITKGDFSDSTQNNGYLSVEVIVSKTSAGIFLHELKKSNPAETFSEPVQINMTNSSGQELHLISNRKWNSSGGILIEKNNNDYSEFRIFLLQNKGLITVEIKAPGSKIYHFSINTDGFSDSFTRI